MSRIAPALALLAPSSVRADEAVRLLSLPSGCLDEGSGNIHLVSVLFERFAHGGGAATMETSGSS